MEATPGLPGGGSKKTGRGGRSATIDVPVGTVVWDISGDEPQEIVDLMGPGWTAVVANGGEPGRGNVHFSSSTNQEPLLAEAGEQGEVVRLRLEVKILADVAIVGAPNAGKSTLLSRVSRAQPKIADYPFTTIEPVLGVVERYGRSMVLLDVPGLIEGAHEGKGLGLEFLRHAERVRVLVHLVDGTAEDLVQEYQHVRAELDAYPPGLGDKSREVAVSKVDIPEVRARFEAQHAALADAGGVEPIALSPATGEGVEQLLEHLLALVPTERPTPERVDVPRKDFVDRRREPPRIYREDDAFVVEHHGAERMVAIANLENWSARMQFHRELGRLGILKALEAAGAESGDTVRIGGAELEWQ